MNIWKLTSLSLAVALVASVGAQTAWGAQHDKAGWRTQASEAADAADAAIREPGTGRPRAPSNKDGSR
jgi:hypothetical protein